MKKYIISIGAFILSLVAGIMVDVMGFRVNVQFGSIVSISLIGAIILYELEKKDE